MSELKFSCPNCQQHIEADEGYAGVQIACPACKALMIVPGSPTPPSAQPTPPAPSLASAPPPPTTSGGCPSCGAPLARGAVLCIQCGYNLATKKRIVAGRVVPPGASMAPSGDVPWYKMPYPYIVGGIILLAALYYFGRDNPPLMLAFLGIAGLYSVTVHICVIVSAFKESTGTGFLTMCIPFYALYYVYKVSDSPTLQAYYSIALVINIILRFLPTGE